jgi:hypothetical protein
MLLRFISLLDLFTKLPKVKWHLYNTTVPVRGIEIPEIRRISAENSAGIPAEIRKFSGIPAEIRKFSGIPVKFIFPTFPALFPAF